MIINLRSGKVQHKTIEPIKPPGRLLENWLLGYGQYTEDSEAPPSFHLWVGLGLIASAMRRRCVMRSAHFEVFTNMYVVLTAPPGTARKTTALVMGRKILKEVPGIHFSTKATSPAALIAQFAALPEKEHQSLCAISYELGTLLGSNNNDMVDLLTDLYDCNPDWDKQTISRSLEKIPRPWLNLQTATTPQWLGEHLPATAIQGGLLSRMVFVYHDKRSLKQPFPIETPAHREMKRKLVNDLTHISTLNGDFKFGPGAFELYDKWYRDESRFPSQSDERTGGYYERKHIHVLKVAMLLSAAERDTLTIETRDLEMAMQLLGQIEPGMHKAFSGMGRNFYATDFDRIFKQISSFGDTGMPYSQVVSANYHALNKQTMDEILVQLVAAGNIRLVPGNRYVSTR